MAAARIVRRAEGETLSFWQFKATGGQTQGQFDFMVGEVAYLSGPPLHTHREQHDTFFVLEGVLKLQAGEELFDLGPGDFATVPPGVPHTFDNVRKDQRPVKTINLMSPGGFHDLLTTYSNAGPPDPAVLERDYGVVAVGPTLREKLGLA